MFGLALIICSSVLYKKHGSDLTVRSRFAIADFYLVAYFLLKNALMVSDTSLVIGAIGPAVTVKISTSDEKRLVVMCTYKIHTV